MTRSARDKAEDAAAHAQHYQEGYRSGLTGAYAPNPWDGRIKAGREWRRGYMNGMHDHGERQAEKERASIRGRVEAASRVLNEARKGNDA